jgi:DNA-binding XRE family transcriptional regulator
MDYQKYRVIPNKLREYRRARNLTQEQVASSLHLKNKTLIARWERQRSIPSLITAFRLSALYQVPVDEMFYKIAGKVREEVVGK